MANIDRDGEDFHLFQRYMEITGSYPPGPTPKKRPRPAVEQATSEDAATMSMVPTEVQDPTVQEEENLSHWHTTPKRRARIRHPSRDLTGGDDAIQPTSSGTDPCTVIHAVPKSQLR